MSLGVERNEKCLFVVDDDTKDEFMNFFREQGFDVDDLVKSGQFEFLTKDQSYLKDGYFDPEKTIASIEEFEVKAIKEGYNGLRTVGEMAWVFSNIHENEKLMEYESKLNDFLRGSNITALCQYSEDKFGPEILTYTLRTHPRVILNGDLHENPYYIPPKDFLEHHGEEEAGKFYEIMKKDIVKIRNLKKTEKSVKEDLKEEHRRLETLFNNIPGVAYRCLNNEDWTMKFLSEGCKDLTGYSSSDLIDDKKISYGEVIVPEDRDLVWNEVQAAIENREPFKINYRIKTKNGEEKWVWEQGRGIFSENEELKFLEGFITDITERKKLDEELRKSEQEKSLILESSPSLIVYQNLDHEIVWTNKRAAESVEKEPSELSGRKCYKIWAQREEPCGNCPLEKSWDTGEIERGEIETPDGRVWLIVAAPTKDKSGEITGAVESALDITERKKDKEKIQELSQFRERIINDANIWLNVFDESFREKPK